MDTGYYYLPESPEKLGKGSYGEVLKGFDKTTKQPVAVKKLSKDEVFSQSADKELSGLKKLRDHKNVVALLEMYKDGENIYLITEFCDKGDLEHYIKEAQPNLQQKLNIMYECASAINFMHNLNPPVIHRDLKLANILLKTIEEDQAIVKICDFGVAKIFESSNIEQIMMTDTGTLAFRAPEFFRKEDDGTLVPYTSAVDTFALGLVFQVVLNYGIEGKYLSPRPVGDTGNSYISIGMDMMIAREQGKRYPILFTVRPGEAKPLPEIKAIVSRMTTFEPEDRMKIGDVEKELQTLTQARDKEEMVSSTEDNSLVIDNNIPYSALITMMKKSKDLQNQYKNTAMSAPFTALFLLVFSVFRLIELIYGRLSDNTSVNPGAWKTSCMVTLFMIVIGTAAVYSSVVMVLQVVHAVFFYGFPLLVVFAVASFVYINVSDSSQVKVD